MHAIFMTEAELRLIVAALELSKREAVRNGERYERDRLIELRNRLRDHQTIPNANAL